jgi:hypothetical protein
LWRRWHQLDRSVRRRIVVAASVLGFLIVVPIVASIPIGTYAIVRSVQGRSHLITAERALRDQRAVDATVSFGRAAQSFRAARKLLDFPLFAPARWLPLLSPQIRGASAIVRSGELSARAGVEATGAIAVEPQGWALNKGAVDLGHVRVAAAAAKAAVPYAEQALAALDAAPRRGLLSPIRSARRQAEALIVPALDGLRKASEGLERLPGLLGESGTKRYVIAFVNPAELRGTGGFFGYFTILEAKGGRFTLTKSGRPTEEFEPLFSDADVPEWFAEAYGRYGATRMWQQVNMSPDFPTVAKAIARRAAPDGRPADGVIQIDPAGIAALLELAGDVRWGPQRVAVTSKNVERILQHGIYTGLRDRRVRGRLTGELVDAAFNKALGQRLPVKEKALEALGTAASQGHIQVYASDPLDQGALSRMGLTSELRRVGDASDVLGVVSSNAVGNKIDWFLRRRIAYHVVLDPRSGSATGELRAEFDNAAPSKRQPRIVIESKAPDITQAGTNRQIVVLVRPSGDQVLAVERDGQPRRLLATKEGTLSGFHGSIDVPPNNTGVLEARFRTPGALRGSRNSSLTYRLHILHQPTVVDDVYQVSVETPPGWAVTGQPSFTGSLDRDLVMEVTMRRTGRAGGLVETFIKGPGRLLKGLVARIF